MATVTLNKVQKSYGDVHVIQGVDTYKQVA